MAVAYLNEGATSFAAGNWTDATGFADDATLVINTPGNQTISASLDQSGLGTGAGNGPESLDVYAPFAGFIGSTAAGALTVAFEGTPYSEANHVSRFRYWAAGGECRYTAGAGSCHLLEVGGAGKMFVTGGALEVVCQDGGSLNVNASTTFADTGRVDLQSGTSYIDTHGSDLIGFYNALGGTHTLKRGGVAVTGTLRVGSGATVTLDSTAGAWPLIIVDGGTLIWVSAGAPGTTAGNVEFRSGLVDFSRINRAVTFQNARHYSSCTIRNYNSRLLTWTTPLAQGAGATLS